MKLRSLALLCFAASMLAAADPALPRVRSIYILSMSGGLDQYLANSLTRGGRFQVVTDPALADAVMTDRLGPEFEMRFTELYPPPEPPEPEKPAKNEEEEKEMEEGSLAAFSGPRAIRISSLSRGRGNVFLVDRGSRRVMWSAYRRVKNTRPEEMDRLASAYADRLHGDVKQAAKMQPMRPMSTTTAAPKIAEPTIVDPPPATAEKPAEPAK